MVPVVWLAIIGEIYSQITPFFALNRIFFSANETTLKTKQPIRFQGLFKVTNQIAGKWKTKSISCGKFCNFCFQNSYPPPQKKWMNLISNQLSTTSINILTDQILYLGNFKMDVIKLKLNLVLCNFGPKSYLWFEMELALHAHLILKSHIHMYYFSPNCTLLSSVTIINVT